MQLVPRVPGELSVGLTPTVLHPLPSSHPADTQAKGRGSPKNGQRERGKPRQRWRRGCHVPGWSLPLRRDSGAGVACRLRAATHSGFQGLRICPVFRRAAQGQYFQPGFLEKRGVHARGSVCQRISTRSAPSGRFQPTDRSYGKEVPASSPQSSEPGEAGEAGEPSLWRGDKVAWPWGCGAGEAACPGFSWDKVSFLPSSRCSAVVWI